MTTELKHAAAFLAPVCLAMANQRKIAPPDVKRHLRSALKWLVRDLEGYVSPLVSRGAYKRAEPKGIVLHDQVWIKQRKWDPKREIFHWEHVRPVADITNDILALGQPTASDVERILATAMVAWILKTEDKDLPRSERGSNPLTAYAKAGIVFVDRLGQTIEMPTI